jgi:uncharacterized membrane protein
LPAVDWTHLHLALNHVPVIGTPFLLLLLLWGWARRSAEITRLALLWLVPFAALSIALKFTGDFAAEESAGRLKPLREFVERHEQAADQATTGMFLLGLAAALALGLGRRGRSVPSWSLALVAALGLATALLLARTANLGGQIGHPQLRHGPP